MTTPSKPGRARSALVPIAGAVLLTVLAVYGAIFFLQWRAARQRAFFEQNGEKCRKGEVSACDSLRSACRKRSGDACVTLADAHLVPGPAHDPREALRLLEEGCEYHQASACARAGTTYAEGRDVPRDPARAKDLLGRACALGDSVACTAKTEVGP